MKVLSLLCFLLMFTEVYSQTYPHVYFMGQTLADHSYVDITTVGGFTDNVQCITDLITCCSGAQGLHRGDWYFPDGDRLQFSGGDIIEQRDNQRVEIRHFNNANSPTGIYRCDIPTNAVHSDTDISVRETVYVGLYTSSGGDVTISGGVTYDSDQMTLTCISTGGPATTVTWTRDFTTITGGQTVLNDPVIAQYTHNLTLAVDVEQPGNYTCTVANNKPSSASRSYIIPGGNKEDDDDDINIDATSYAVTTTTPTLNNTKCGKDMSSPGAAGTLGGILTVVVVSSGVVIAGLVALVVNLRQRLIMSEEKYHATLIQRDHVSTRKEMSATETTENDVDDGYEPVFAS